MAPKKQPSLAEQLKARVQAQKQLEEKIKQEAEEAEKKLREEERLAEEQRRIEEAEKYSLAELEKAKKKNDKNDKLDDERKRGLIERMRLSGMIMPENYKGVEQITVAPIKQKEYKHEREQESDTQFETILRAPIIAVFGHVDSGKTTLLDCIRNTNQQSHETRGITQNTSATVLSREMLVNKCQNRNKDEIKIPGLLLIDIPGHESFSNMKDRGSNICDMALLVIDIMSGVQQETKAAIDLLIQKRCKFMIALNKIDRLYAWKTQENISIRESLSLQKPNVVSEYEKRTNRILLQLQEHGLNVALFHKNPDPDVYIPIVPVSAVTGEGISDLLDLQIDFSQSYLAETLIYKPQLECTVLEISPMTNMGLTADIILVNGVLSCGDKVLLNGIHGPVVTRIKKIMINDCTFHKSIKASMTAKIFADHLGSVVPGSSISLVTNEETENTNMQTESILSKLVKNEIGVSVYASTCGVMEAILKFLEEKKVPVNFVSLGDVYKKHLTNIIKTSEKDQRYAVMLTFDVEITEEAKALIKKHNIRVCSSNVIYTLFNQFQKQEHEYNDMLKEKNRDIAIFPVMMNVIVVFHNKNPIIVGCKIQKGILKLGTPLIVKQKEGIIDIGKVIGIQKEKKEFLEAKEGEEVAIKIQCSQNNISFGRTIEKDTILYSKITRQSIDALKESFRDEMRTEDWKLIIDLKAELMVV